MKNKERFILLVSGCLALIIGSCSGKDNYDCNPSVTFYSLDREANNVLRENVLTGDFYALNPDGSLAQHKVLNPVPDKMPLTLGMGDYDLFIIGNLSDAMLLDGTSGGSSVSAIRVKPRTNEYYYSANDLHIGFLDNYPMQRPSRLITDSIHVKRVVGRVSVHVKDVMVSEQQFRFAMIVSGVAQGINLYRQPIVAPVNIIEYGEIVDRKVAIDAICFSSIAPLKITAQLIDKSSGNVILTNMRTLDEPLTPNKHIIVEYNFSTGNFVEFDIIIKDWDNKNDSSSGEAN